MSAVLGPLQTGVAYGVNRSIYLAIHLTHRKRTNQRCILAPIGSFSGILKRSAESRRFACQEPRGGSATLRLARQRSRPFEDPYVRRWGESPAELGGGGDSELL